MAEVLPAPRSRCLSTARIDGFLAGSTSASERFTIVDHLSLCRRCRELLAERHDRELPISVAEVVPREIKDRVVALVDDLGGRMRPVPAAPVRGGGPAPAGREVGERHRAGGRRLAATIATVAAALLAVAGLAIRTEVRNRPEPAAVRAREPAVAPPRLEATESRSDAGAVDLRWSATPGAVAYRLVVVDGVGELVTQVDLDGSRRSHRLERDALPRDGPFYWYVQARFADGTALASTTEPLPGPSP